MKHILFFKCNPVSYGTEIQAVAPAEGIKLVTKERSNGWMVRNRKEELFREL